MRINRGLSFIVGVVGLFLLTRLYSLGLLTEVSDSLISWLTGADRSTFRTYSSTGVLEDRSPAGLISEFLVEAVMAFGTVIILSLEGMWSVLGIGVQWAGDISQTLLRYLRVKERNEDRRMPPPMDNQRLFAAAIKQEHEFSQKLAKSAVLKFDSISKSLAEVKAEVERLSAQCNKDSNNVGY